LVSKQRRLVNAFRLTVHCPVGSATYAAILRGDYSPLREDPGTARVLALIEASAELGNFGLYRGVCEISPCVEAFTPQPESRPAVGAAGERSATSAVAIATYIDGTVSQERLDQLVAGLAAVHPWELPVIEVQGVRLLRMI
jgi:hypothetical protein